MRRRCKSRGAQAINPKIDFGCAEWCAYAEQCVGNISLELREKRGEFLKDRIAWKMRKVFGKDSERINHANKVVRFAEEILKGKGGDPAVVIAAAYPYDIGIHEAERKYSSTAGNYQEGKGPPIARKILERLGANRHITEEVCDPIARHHTPGPIQTINFQILWEADSLANLDKATERELDQIKEVVEITSKTSTGKRLAEALLHDKSENSS